jgi:Cu/Ag efflux protein CusF
VSYRILPLFLALLALAVFTAAPALADDKPGTHEGIVVKAADGKLTMTDKDGKNEHTHTIPADAAITLAGKAGKLDGLKKGDKVFVTIEKKGDKNVVTKVEVK